MFRSNLALITTLGLLGATGCSQGVDDGSGLTFGPAAPTASDTTADDDDDDDDLTSGSAPTSGGETDGGGGDDDDDDPSESQGTDDPTDPTDPTAPTSDTEDPSDTSDPTDTTGSSGDCDPGDTRSCYSGPVNTENVGICTAGSQTCAGDGSWGACEGETLPGIETCNDEDDDCNGTADDGNPGGGGSCNTGLSGPCQSGTLVCEGGALVCDGDVDPAASEICGNDIDDDCNGTPDDGCLCDPSFPQGACGAGEHCFPTTTGDTFCQGPSGVGIQYNLCDGDEDCALGLACIDIGGGIARCLEWCTSFVDCPFSLDDCVPLTPSVSAGPQEWGVCYDGLG